MKIKSFDYDMNGIIWNSYKIDHMISYETKIIWYSYDNCIWFSYEVIFIWFHMILIWDSYACFHMILIHVWCSFYMIFIWNRRMKFIWFSYEFHMWQVCLCTGSLPVLFFEWKHIWKHVSTLILHRSEIFLANYFRSS